MRPSGEKSFGFCQIWRIYHNSIWVKQCVYIPAPFQNMQLWLHIHLEIVSTTSHLNCHDKLFWHRFMADLVIGLLQDLSAHILTTSCCHPTHPPHMADLYSQLPIPLLSDLISQKQVENCYMDFDFKALEKSSKVDPCYQTSIVVISAVSKNMRPVEWSSTYISPDTQFSTWWRAPCMIVASALY